MSLVRNFIRWLKTTDAQLNNRPRAIHHSQNVQSFFSVHCAQQYNYGEYSRTFCQLNKNVRQANGIFLNFFCKRSSAKRQTAKLISSIKTVFYDHHGHFNDADVVKK